MSLIETVCRNRDLCLKNGSSSADSAQKQSCLLDQGGFIGKFGISSFQQVYYKIEFKLVTKFSFTNLSAVKPPLKQMEGYLKQKVKPKCGTGQLIAFVHTG